MPDNYQKILMTNYKNCLFERVVRVLVFKYPEKSITSAMKTSAMLEIK